MRSDFQRRGIGRALYEQFEKDCRGMLPHMPGDLMQVARLHTQNNYPATRGAFEKHGYQAVSQMRAGGLDGAEKRRPYVVNMVKSVVAI